MVSDKMSQTLNDQIQAEFYSAYLYLAMSAYFEDQSLPGFAKWMQIQSQEEWDHGMRIYNYLFQRDGRVVLKEIEAPQAEWDSPLAAFQDAYAHEKKVSEMIDNIANLSLQEKDNATNSFIQWFVNEQVEEEDTAKSIVDQLKLVGDTGNGLFMLDRELGQRPAEGGDEGDGH